MPHPFYCSRLAWMGLRATWCSGMCLCAWLGLETSLSLRYLPIQTFLWFYDSMLPLPPTSRGQHHAQNMEQAPL